MSDITVVVETTVCTVVVENLAGGPAVEIEATADPISIVIAEVGPQGPPGASSGNRQADAGAPVSGHRVLVQLDDGTVIHADAATPDHVQRVVGVSTNAAIVGDPVAIVGDGPVSDNSLSFTPGLPVFLGLNGAMTQTPPADPAAIIQVGAALAADTINVRISRPIYRS